MISGKQVSLLLSVPLEREGGHGDGNEDGVAHPGGVPGVEDPLVQGTGTGVPGSEGETS